MRLLRRAFKYSFMQLKNTFRLRKAQFLWLKNNRHNKTRMGNYFPADRVSVGRYTYGNLVVHHFEAEGEGLQIGDFCSIGPDVEFFLGGEHHPRYLSNYPFGLYFTEMKCFENMDRTSKGRIIVDDDVWIGAHSLIMSGVHIGRGAIVGAGTVVAKDVPPYAIFVNGRIIKYRFQDNTIQKLMKLDYSKLDVDFLKNNGDLFYTEDIERVLEKLID